MANVKTLWWIKCGNIYHGMTLSNKEELLIRATICMNLKNMLEWKKPDAKEYILYNTIYIKILEKVKLWKQKTDQWLWGGWGEGADELQMIRRELAGVTEVFYSWVVVGRTTRWILWHVNHTSIKQLKIGEFR